MSLTGKVTVGVAFY